MLFKNVISNHPFMQWFKYDSENRRLLRLATLVILLQFIAFKFLYPYPNFIPPDSNLYIEAALKKQFINIWPIGYSKFLWFINILTSSSVVLVWIQYLLLEASILYFQFSLRYLVAPGKWSFRIILSVSILNPLMVHISNFVSSDALFTALSLIWFTQLLWMLYRPTKRLLIAHAFILTLAFAIRYNALYYPLISILIILFYTDLKKRTKVLSIGLILFFLAIFIGKTQYEYYKETGNVQFSAFSGWQLAANALYGYAHTIPDSPSNIPVEFRNLHNLVNDHIRSLNKIAAFARPDNDVGIYYLWNFNSPLRVYMDKQWKNNATDDSVYFKQWASMAPLYYAYGFYLIRHHPIPFVKYYIWPNLLKYYLPPTGFLGYYNLGKDTVSHVAASWFGWKTNKIANYFNDRRIEVTDVLTIVVPIINVAFILGFLAFILLNGFNKCTIYSKNILLCMFTIWVCNIAFSVFSAPIEIRYQLFSIAITFTFLGLFFPFLYSESIKNKSI